MKKTTRIEVAHKTLAIIEKGFYINSNNEKVDVNKQQSEAVRNSILYKPTMKVTNIDDSSEHKAKVTVTNETTLEAARRLIVNEGIRETVCLNFASAKNPGGGFLGGSQAQEESLARSTGLYPCIVQMEEMYRYNRRLSTCLYSDYMVYSPFVPVLRDDEGELFNEPFQVSIITAPAVNAGVVRARKVKEDIEKIDQVMMERIRKILTVASEHKNKVIVLGAYGCGVFRNNPMDVAEYFRKILIDEGFNRLFDQVIFAIYDTKNLERINMFKKIFQKGCVTNE